MTVRPAPSGVRPLFRALCSAVSALSLVTGSLAPVAAARAQDEGPPLVLIRDTEIEAILHEDADPIFTAAGLNPKAVHIYIVGDPSLENMNSFVAGGQNMFITTGLIMRTKNPNELMGVMAHETGHMAGGHLIRSAQGEKQVLAAYLLTIGLGILAAAAGAPDAGAGLLYSSDYFAALTGAGFTRTQEASADQAAVTYLEKSGHSARGLVSFFDNFRYEEVFSEAKRYKFFMDHPLTSDRIQALQVRAQQQAHYNQVDSPEAMAKHLIMIAKLRAFEDLPDQTFQDYPSTDTSFPGRYARAIAYYRDLQTDRAIKATDDLITDQPDDPYLYELKGQILYEAGRAKEGEVPLSKAVALKPDAPLLEALYAQDLIAENDPAKLDEAVLQLHRSLVVEPDSPYSWLFLSQAYDKQGDEGLARLAAAEENFYLGQTDDARSFAMRARHLLPKGGIEWRRATDIVLVSKPTKDDLKMLAQEGSVAAPIKKN